MGLATIDPRSHKVQTKLYKIHEFGVNRPNSKQDTAIWKCQKSVRSQKEHTEIHKIPKFGYNQARFDRDTAI